MKGTYLKGKSYHVRFFLFLILGIAFTKSLKFGEPYLTLFFVECKRLTEYQVNNLVYPLWTYSDALFRILFVILSTIVQPETLTITEFIFQFLTYCILVFASGDNPYILIWMMLTQVTFGISTAASGGFFGCIARYFEPLVASRWNAHVKALIFAGHVLASISSGPLLGLYRLEFLFILTLIALAITLSFSIFLFICSGYLLASAKSTHQLQEIPGEESTQKRRTSHDTLAASNTSNSSKREIFVPSYEVILLGAIWVVIYSCFGLCENYFSSIIFQYSQTDYVDVYHSGYFDALGKMASFISALLLSLSSWWQRKYRFCLLLSTFAVLLMGSSMLGIAFLKPPFGTLKLGCYWAMLLSTATAVNTFITSRIIEVLTSSSGKMVSFFISAIGMASMFIMSLLQFLLDGQPTSGRFFIMGWIIVTLPVFFFIITFIITSSAEGKGPKHEVAVSSQ